MSELQVNTINEVTSANGVTIDGLSLKDGNVVPAAGKGIDFSAASGSASGSTSALLDDYEEGSFSGVIKLGTTTNTPAGASYFKYTKIGDVVHIWGEATTISKSGSGNLSVEGLPFATISGQMNVNVQVRWAGIATSQGTLIGVINPGDSYMTFQNMDANGFNSTITAGVVSSTYHLYSFNAYYRTS